MPSKREEALCALHSALQTIGGRTVAARNAVLEDDELPHGGLIVLRDGDPGEPDITLGGEGVRLYGYEHVAEIEVLVQLGEAADRDAELDAALQDISTAVHGDRTLGGVVDYVMVGAPEDVDDREVDGAIDQKACIVPATMLYDSPDPLG